jgi:hypothetical protein
LCGANQNMKKELIWPLPVPSTMDFTWAWSFDTSGANIPVRAGMLMQSSPWCLRILKKKIMNISGESSIKDSLPTLISKRTSEINVRFFAGEINKPFCSTPKSQQKQQIKRSKTATSCHSDIGLSFFALLPCNPARHL